jgi:hypothetical protein
MFHFVNPPSRTNGPPQPPRPPEVEVLAEAIPAEPLELDEVVELDEIVELDPAELEILDVEPPAATGMAEVPFTFDLDEPEPPAAVAAEPLTFPQDKPGTSSQPPPRQQPPPSAKPGATSARPAAPPVGVPMARDGAPPPLSGKAAPTPPAVDPAFLEPETGLIPESVVRRRPAIKLTFVAPGGTSPLASS